MTIEQHIEELRAELRGNVLTRKERAAIEAELKDALEVKAAQDGDY